MTAAIIAPISYLICYAVTQDKLEAFKEVPCMITEKSYTEVNYNGLCPETVNYVLHYTVSAQVRDHPTPPDTGYETLPGCLGKHMVCYKGVNPANNYVCPWCELTSVDNCVPEVTLDLTEYNKVELNVPRKCWRHRIGKAKKVKGLGDTLVDGVKSLKEWTSSSLGLAQPATGASAELEALDEALGDDQNVLIFLHNPKVMVDYPTVPAYWLYPAGVAVFLGIWSLYYFLRSGLIRSAWRKCRGTPDAATTSGPRWFVSESDRNNAVLETNEEESCCPCVGGTREANSSDAEENLVPATALYPDGNALNTPEAPSTPFARASRSFSVSRPPHNTVVLDTQHLSSKTMSVGSMRTLPSTLPPLSKNPSFRGSISTTTNTTHEGGHQASFGSYRPPSYLPMTMSPLEMGTKYAQPSLSTTAPIPIPRTHQGLDAPSPYISPRPTSQQGSPAQKPNLASHDTL